jgi:O-6-methylguanine DNA methyltransferase
MPTTYTFRTITPLTLKKHLKQYTSSTAYYQTSAGILKMLKTDHGIYQAEFSENNPEEPTIKANLPLLLAGTPFQCKVWQATLTIPAGTIVTYAALAQKIGQPKAWRAVARVLAQNNLAYFIPCHRVIRKDGLLSGYKWGIEKKKALLRTEGYKNNYIT